MWIQVFNIAKYICQNNPWYKIPLRFIQALLWQIEKRLTHKIKSKTLFNGGEIFLYPNTPSSSCLVYTDIPDKKAIQALRKLCDQNTIFLDIGANIGLYSLCLMDKVKSIFAFEAHPQTSSFLKMNFLLNHLPLSHICEQAVLDESKEVYFSNFSDGSPVNALMESSKNSIKVQGISLDEFAQNKQLSKNDAYVLKLDVEGAEHLVLEGAQKFLKDYPIKAILFESFSSKLIQIKQNLNQLGFKIIPIMENNLLAVREGEV